VAELLIRKPKIDGVFCTTDTLAIGALKAINDLGLSVPNQVKIVGFDSTSIGEHSVPSLTTVRQAVEEFGKLTVESITDMLNSKPVTKMHHQIPVELVIRGST